MPTLTNPPQPDDLRDKLEEILWAFHEKYGNSLSEWKNKDYDYAHTLPENERLQIRPELTQKILATIKLQQEALLSKLETEIDGVELRGYKGNAHISDIKNVLNKLRLEL